ncbi:MAG: succinylglutamate desuccinylase/aspartoacylase family protein [Deltaproteobacteria bacterium]|nr:succinylglutamate desuccinylase/aspartoacylase family protein [Nannocystaceae bacterium]
MPSMLPFKAVSYASPNPGPKLIVLGAVHGNETCGTRAIETVIEAIDAGDLRLQAGRLTLVPVTNPLAYAERRRAGDRNLNRKLGATTTPMEYEDHVANWLCPLLAEHEVLLDLHSFKSPGMPFAFIGPGDNAGPIEPAGVLGGNVLRDFAIALRGPVDEPASVTFYVEFPGSDRDLADQGRAFLNLQFPGRLLGRDVADRCEIGDDDCRLPGFEVSRAQGYYALRSTRMVLDACVAAPPCAGRYKLEVENLFAPGTCDATAGPDLETACIDAGDPEQGGVRASLLVASSVPGAVLFEDSAVRMFGPLDVLPACNLATLEDRACLLGQDGRLAFSGWPPAGDETPLIRLRMRSIALVPGSTRTRDVGPCERVQERREALVEQCVRYVEAIEREGDVRNTTPPYSADADDDSSGGGSDAANTSLAVLGETSIEGTLERPDPSRWIEVHVLPSTHPLPVSLRLDLSPEAAQLDGLIGTSLLRGTVAVLDYTDPNPGVRLSCLDPRGGECMVAPECQKDAQPACCYGLPLNLLVDFIVQADDETCCAALSAGELEEIQSQGYCLGTQPP